MTLGIVPNFPRDAIIAIRPSLAIELFPWSDLGLNLAHLRPDNAYASSHFVFCSGGTRCSRGLGIHW